MSLIESGVIMRHGTERHGGITIWRGRTQREVHPARRDEAISYRIESDDYGVHYERDGERWPHFTYRFIYRYLGRTISITWHCGTSYTDIYGGKPRPFDGIQSAFRDAETVAWEAFTPSWAADLGLEDDMAKAQRIYNACERMEERLTRLFDNDDEKSLWGAILTGIENDEENFNILDYAARDAA